MDKSKETKPTQLHKRKCGKYDVYWFYFQTKFSLIFSPQYCSVQTRTTSTRNTPKTVAPNLSIHNMNHVFINSFSNAELNVKTPTTNKQIYFFKKTEEWKPFTQYCWFADLNHLSATSISRKQSEWADVKLKRNMKLTYQATITKCFCGMAGYL